MENFEPKIIAMVCTYCTYTAADMAGSMRLQYPTNVRIVRTPCTGRLEVEFFMKAFEKAAAYGVDHPESAVNYAMDKYSKDFKLVKAEQTEQANVIVNNYLKKYKTDKGYHYVDLNNWQVTIDQLFEQKAITSKPALKDVVTTEITECVTKK